MLKWRGNVTDKPTIGIGLEPEDLIGLMQGKAIKVNRNESMNGFDIFIHYGSSKEVLIKQLNMAKVVPEGTVESTSEPTPAKKKKRRRNRVKE